MKLKKNLRNYIIKNLTGQAYVVHFKIKKNYESFLVSFAKTFNQTTAPSSEVLNSIMQEQLNKQCL